MQGWSEWAEKPSVSLLIGKDFTVISTPFLFLKRRQHNQLFVSGQFLKRISEIQVLFFEAATVLASDSVYRVPGGF